MPTHGRNKSHTTTSFPANHLLRDSLRRHEHARDVDLEHRVRILSSVVQRRSLLLNPRCREQSIHPALLVRDALHNLVQLHYVPDIDLAVVQRRA